MNLRLIPAVLVAGASASLASADVVPTVNAKTAKQPYTQASQKQAQARALLQKKLLAAGQGSQQLTQGTAGMRAASAGSWGGTIALGGGDDCSAPDVVVGTGTFAFDTTVATTSVQQPSCGGGSDYDVWFSWTAPTTGVATFATCLGSGMDTVIAAWTGSGCGGTEIACNDDTCGLQSSVTFPVTGGTNYMLQLGGYNISVGPGTFTLGISTGGPPANDSCSTPTVIAGFGTFGYDNVLATTGTEGQAEPLCNAYATTVIGGDVWYRWTSPSTGPVTMSLCGLTAMDSKIAAYAGSACPVSGTALACSDDACAFQSQITFAANSGSTYMLQLGRYATAQGSSGTFSISAGFGGGPPNDDCSNPDPISGTGLFNFDNSTATTGAQGQTESLCNAFGTTVIGHDLWFDWTAPNSGTATITLCNMAAMDSKLAVYDGSSCPAAGSAIACNDDTAGCGLTSEVVFPVTGGNHYMLQLGTYEYTLGTAGQFSIDVPLVSPLTYGCEPGQAGVINCPCGNPAGGGARGCDNSDLTGGASIFGVGSVSLATPTLVFTTSGETSVASTIVMQGDAMLPNGVVFGQGVRCVSGALLRLYIKSAVGGSITAPDFGLGDPDVPTQSASLGGPIAPGQMRSYMAYYRDPIVLGGCPSTSTFNGTNAGEVVWLP
jgi:hypothetical protein